MKDTFGVVKLLSNRPTHSIESFISHGPNGLLIEEEERGEDVLVGDGNMCCQPEITTAAPIDM